MLLSFPHSLRHIFIKKITSRYDPCYENPGVLLLVLVQPPVDEGEAEAAAAAVHHDRAGLQADNHPDWLPGGKERTKSD